MLPQLNIRPLQADDAEPMSRAFAAQGWQKPAEQYRRYYVECEAGTRAAFVAEMAGAFAGYVTVLWQSDYPHFQSQNIPEIADFNVLKRYQRLGIGTRLMDAAEAEIVPRSPVAGIGVGLTVDYGPAHLLYLRRGYIPDGQGLMSHNLPVAYGQSFYVDDELVLFFIKTLTT
jgi:GNAT superfamily N-acetyltransferase